MDMVSIPVILLQRSARHGQRRGKAASKSKTSGLFLRTKSMQRKFSQSYRNLAQWSVQSGAALIQRVQTAIIVANRAIPTLRNSVSLYISHFRAIQLFLSLPSPRRYPSRLAISSPATSPAVKSAPLAIAVQLCPGTIRLPRSRNCRNPEQRPSGAFSSKKGAVCRATMGK